MGDQQHGQAELAAQIGNQGQDVAGGFRVQRAGGFVAQHQGWPVGQGTGDADALFLATGQLGGVGAGPLAQPDQGEQFRHPRLALGGRYAGDFQRQGDVAGGGAAGKQVEMLEHHADPAAGAGQGGAVQRQQIIAGHDDPAAVGPFQQVDTAQQRGFTRAGSADDTEHAASRDIQRNAIQCRMTAGEHAAQIFQPHHRRLAGYVGGRHEPGPYQNNRDI